MSSRETGGGIALGDILDQALQGRVQNRRPTTGRAFQPGDSTHAEWGAGRGRLALMGHRESGGISNSRVGTTQA